MPCCSRTTTSGTTTSTKAIFPSRIPTTRISSRACRPDRSRTPDRLRWRLRCTRCRATISSSSRGTTTRTCSARTSSATKRTCASSRSTTSTGAGASPYLITSAPAGIFPERFSSSTVRALTWSLPGANRSGSGALLAGQPHPAVPVRCHAAGETAGGLIGARRFAAQVVIRQGALGYSAGRPGDDLPLLFHCAEIGDVAVRTQDLSEDFLGRPGVVERERQPQVLVAIEHLQHRGTAALDFHAEAVRLDPGENAADHRRREGQPGEEKGDGARDQRCPPLPHQGTARSYASLAMNSRPGPGSGAWPALYGCA